MDSEQMRDWYWSESLFRDRAFGDQPGQFGIVAAVLYWGPPETFNISYVHPDITKGLLLQSFKIKAKNKSSAKRRFTYLWRTHLRAKAILGR